MLRDIFRFNKAAARDHEAGLSGDETLGNGWIATAFQNRFASLSPAHGRGYLVDTGI